MPVLHGLIVPLVTPFDHRGTVDTGALLAVADYVLARGANGLMLTALTGEGNLLSAEETRTVWSTILDRYRSQTPIIPAIFSTTTADAIRLGRLSAELGADAVMVAAIMPELYGRRADAHVLRFFEAFSAAAHLPIVLFNYPSVAGYDLTPPLVAGLSTIPNIRYIKESTSDSRRVSDILALTAGRMQVICGSPDIALESLALGCTAWITAITNFVPAASRALIDAIANSDLTRARTLNANVIRLSFEILRQSSNTVGSIKAGLRLCGIEVGDPRPPGLPLVVDAPIRAAFERIFAAEHVLLGTP